MPPVELFHALEEGQRRGLLGPGPVEPQVGHALALGEAAGGPPFAGRALDLGSGGGLPGLVLAVAWPQSVWVLLDSRRRSAAFLTEAVVHLGLAGRVRVLEARAEDVGRDPRHRSGYALVTARGFAGAAITAECAAPLLEVGGRLVVSEPPGGAVQRWPEDGVGLVGLRLEAVVVRGSGSYAVLQQLRPCPSTYPRRAGVPAKRPLFPNPQVDVSRETNAVLDPSTAGDEDKRQ